MNTTAGQSFHTDKFLDNWDNDMSKNSAQECIHYEIHTCIMLLKICCMPYE